jgi:undecaprenyl-diphosphatase
MYLKSLFAFERPVYEQAIETSFSYPSGHTAISAVFLILSSYIYTHQMQVKHKKVYIGIAVCISVSIAASRLFLGEHWLSDIVGGYLLAILCSSISILLFESHIAQKALQAKES